MWQGRKKWYKIGLQLGLPPGDLDSIKEFQHNDPDHCITATLNVWLTSSYQPSWSSLAEALRATSVGYCDLADQIDQLSARDRTNTL